MEKLLIRNNVNQKRVEQHFLRHLKEKKAYQLRTLTMKITFKNEGGINFKHTITERIL